VPALDATPQQAWARAVNRAVRDANASQLDYQHAAGFRQLREVLAAYLAVARGVRCTADQVIVVAGAQAGLSLAAKVLLDARDAVWMEDPGYFLAQAVFQAADVTVIPPPLLSSENAGKRLAFACHAAAGRRSAAGRSAASVSAARRWS
jgi:GntR family transcriptional regulator/MocR family aminotransferase